MPPQELNISPLPVLPPPHKSSKHFIWFLIGFIALGIAGWVYYSIQKTESESSIPDSMAVNPEVKSDWKTYRNDQYGFEIKYPSDWVKNDRTKGITIVNNKAELSTVIVVIPLADNFIPPSDGMVSKQKQILNGNIESTLYSFNDGGNVYIIDHNNIRMSIGTANYPYSETEKNTIDQILSTFKFISTSTASTNSPYSELTSNDIAQPTISVPPLFPKVKWTEMPNDISITDGYFKFYYDNFDYVKDQIKRIQKFAQLPGHLWTAVFHAKTNQELDNMNSDFSKYYENSLVNSGWSFSQKYDKNQVSFQSPAADGPTGSIWGYLKIQNDKLKLIGFSYQITNYNDTGSDGPVEVSCPCDLELKVFVSDEANITNFSLK